MDNIIMIEDYIIKIIKDNYRNAYIGKFVNTSEFKNIYGDSINEIITIAEELIKQRSME